MFMKTNAQKHVCRMTFFPSLRPNRNGIHQVDLLLLQTHAVELLVGALQTLLGLLGFQEILQTFIKIELSYEGGGGVR